MSKPGTGTEVHPFKVACRWKAFKILYYYVVIIVLFYCKRLLQTAVSCVYLL